MCIVCNVTASDRSFYCRVPIILDLAKMQCLMLCNKRLCLCGSLHLYWFLLWMCVYRFRHFLGEISSHRWHHYLFTLWKVLCQWQWEFFFTFTVWFHLLFLITACLHDFLNSAADFLLLPVWVYWWFNGRCFSEYHHLVACIYYYYSYIYE